MRDDGVSDDKKMQGVFSVNGDPSITETGGELRNLRGDSAVIRKAGQASYISNVSKVDSKEKKRYRLIDPTFIS
jgi:hypothetical protein